MLAHARARVPIACADGRRLPFQDGAFDGVLCAAVLEFSGDPAALLAEARRVATTRVAVLSLNACSYLGLRRRAAGWRGHPIFRHVDPKTRRALFEASRRAGAEPERVRSVLYLPPALGARLAGLERRFGRSALPGGGILGWSLRGGERSQALAPGAIVTWMRPIRSASVLMPTLQGEEFLERVLDALAAQQLRARLGRPRDRLGLDATGRSRCLERRPRPLPGAASPSNRSSRRVRPRRHAQPAGGALARASCWCS